MKKKIIFVVILLSILAVTLAAFMYSRPDNSIVKTLKGFVPSGIKEDIKSVLFAVPELRDDVERHRMATTHAIREIGLLKTRLNALILKDLKVDKTSYKIHAHQNKLDSDLYFYSYEIPVSDYYISKKPGFYLDVYKETLVLVSGVGEVFFFDKSEIFDNAINLHYLDSNIEEVISDTKFFDKLAAVRHSSKVSVKDVLIIDDTIYFSYTKEAKKNCYNTSIMSARIDFEKLRWQEFFSYDACVDVNDPYTRKFFGQQSGGRMARYAGGKMLFTVGEYRLRPAAQDDASILGKIIEIDIATKDYRVFSKGHRNPQGLAYLEDQDRVISTEHGPYGGDEVNVVYAGKNYGWPISSYGQHYDGTFKKEAPLHKSHKDHGFEEPIFHWDAKSTIGVSQIVPMQKAGAASNQFLVGSMLAKTLFVLSMDKDFANATLVQSINIGERVRDIFVDRENGLIYLALENSPALGVLSYEKIGDDQVSAHDPSNWSYGDDY